jgi:hypothetical protein
LCRICLLCSLLNCDATNLRSLKTSANASTSVTALTVLVDRGKAAVGCGLRAHVSNSSPQNSPGLIRQQLKNPVRPPWVVHESRHPRIINNIESTGSSSRIMHVPLVKSAGLSRSHIASSILPSISSNSGTFRDQRKQKMVK